MADKRIFNFSAGPAMLPTSVLEQAAGELVNYKGTGMSIMEMSHRGADWMNYMKQVTVDLKEVLHIPDNFVILYPQGGASYQFSAVPLNLMGEKAKADYIVTGTWSKKAAGEAKKYGEVNIVCQPKGAFDHVPPKSEWKFSEDASYVYYCENETIEGVSFPDYPDTGKIPLVCDMSSCFASRPIDWSKFGLVYACPQKNFGPAGFSIVIIRKDLLDVGAHKLCPTVMSYKILADNDSMYNTPSTYCIYIAGLVFKWIKDFGGIEKMFEHNKMKAKILYDAIESIPFYDNPVAPSDRSIMNVPFTCKKPELEAQWLAEAKKLGLVTLKGHRSIGGFRASIYNAMPVEGVQKLVAFMKDFADKNA